MRRRFAHVSSLQTSPDTRIAVGQAGEQRLGDLKLFGLTYAAGFLFVSLFIA
jgi:hypothetical protein